MQLAHRGDFDRREDRTMQQRQKRIPRMARVLRWVLLVGGAGLVGVGVFTIFGGRLASGSIASPAQPPTGTTASSYTTTTDGAFHATTTTTDGALTVTLSISPNQAGPNDFRVSVAATQTGMPITNVEVTLSVTMLDMDMGTQDVTLSPDGKAHFGATGELIMGGNFRIGIQIQTPDHKVHEAIVRVSTP